MEEPRKFEMDTTPVDYVLGGLLFFGLAFCALGSVWLTALVFTNLLTAFWALP